MRKKKTKFNNFLEEISAKQLRGQKKERLRKAFEAKRKMKFVQKRNSRFEALDD
jgi:hypothetical protein